MERRLHAAGVLLVAVLALVFIGCADASVVADFAANPTEGEAPLLVQFTDNSTGTVTSWLWEFGDATYATTQNATHNYTVSAVYPVNLTVTGANSSISNITKPITVYPNASFTRNPPSGPAPLTVQFLDTSTGSPTQWNWEFEEYQNYSTSTLQNPQKTYLYGGNWGVFLNATGKNGQSDYYYSTVQVTPVARFTATPVSGDGPLTVQFNDTSIGMLPANPSDIYLSIFGNRYFWDFGDGSTSNERNPVHVFQNTSTVTLTVAVMFLPNTSAPLQITVGPSPNVDFTASPLTGVAPLTVSFTDVSKGTQPLSYTWNFGDNSTLSHERNPVHLYASAGSFNANLTVTDGNGKTNSKIRTVHATLMPGPVAEFAASPRSGAAPLTVDFIDQSTGEGPLMYLWSFGDNSTLPDRYLKNPVHTYQIQNNYTVSLTVTDINNRTGNKVATDFIRVGSSPSPFLPVANFTVSPVTGYPPLPIQCHDTSTGSPTSWYWKVFYGTGANAQVVNSSNLQSPEFILNLPGTYGIELQVSNALGTSVKTSPVAVQVFNNRPVAEFTASTFNGNVSIPIEFVDKSTGVGIYQWAWNFGDGGASPYQNPVYTYMKPGTFNVTLTVTNNGGSSSITHPMNITGVAPSGDSILLYQGWNFVSVPKKLEIGKDTAGVVFSGIDTGQRSILTYNANTLAWETVSPNHVVTPLEGLWVFSNKQYVVPLHFAAVSPTPVRDMYKGWNTMGFSGLTPRSANQTLQSLGTAWSYVQGYNSLTQTSEIVIVRGSMDPVYSDSRILYPSNGYWIYLVENGTLQGMT